MVSLPVRKTETERGPSGLSRLHREMDDLFHGFLGEWDWPSWNMTSWPAMDIAEQANEYVVKAEILGCKADDINISIHNNTLVLSGEKKEEEKKEGKDFYHIERRFGSFRRELNLANNVDPKKIEASCENGLLTVRVPKSEKTKPVKIKVKGQ
jgi:HSP20 family protein